MCSQWGAIDDTVKLLKISRVQVLIGKLVGALVPGDFQWLYAQVPQSVFYGFGSSASTQDQCLFVVWFQMRAQGVPKANEVGIISRLFPVYVKLYTIHGTYFSGYRVQLIQ